MADREGDIFRLPSTMDAASTAADRLLELASEWSIADELLERIVLVLSEAVANAAEHGNGIDSPAAITVTFSTIEDEVVTCVEDEGKGLDQAQIDRASLPDDPLSQDGRGLYIIREMTDRVWLEAEGRRLCMAWKRR